MKKVETVLMVPPDHPLIQKKRVTWKQIAQYPLILPPMSARNPGRTFLEEQLGRLGIKYRIVMESSNVELSSVYVEIDLGISSANVVKDLPAIRKRKLAFISLNHYFKPDFICVTMRKNKALTPYKNAFLKVLLEWIQ